MKYLKEYNEVELTWSAIMEEEFEIIDNSNKLLSFTGDEFISIKDKLKVRDISIMRCFDNIDIESNLCHMKIFHDSDEWYYIQNRNKCEAAEQYYKCDQVHGLIDCLKHLDKKIVK